jgi:hypothetical protein
LSATELGSLDPPAQLILAALAVASPGSLSLDEVREVTEVSDAESTLAELDRHGLVVREGDRFSLAPKERERKGVLASIDVVDRVLRGFIQIAEDGRLNLADLDAVLGLTRIAAQTGRWTELLRLVEAAETTLSTTRRVEEWVEIVKRRLEAADAVGDKKAARHAQRELDRLGKMGRHGGGVPAATALIAAAAITGVSFGGGYLAGHGSSDGSDSGKGKRAKTVTKTKTEAAQTVTETETVTETQTVATTTTSGVD